jgi:dephospho-CoA kinase
MPLSGKTTVAEAMKDQGFTVLDMGDVVRIEMEKRGLEAEETGSFVNGMREEHGMDAIAQLSIPYLEEMIGEKEKIVITGMRGWSEKEKFEGETGEDIEVVAVWTSRETRRERMEDRQRAEDRNSEKFHERDEREVENGVGKLMALSDHLIKNEGKSLDNLREEVKDLVEP